jgi:hypothetical protein
MVGCKIPFVSHSQNLSLPYLQIVLKSDSIVEGLRGIWLAIKNHEVHPAIVFSSM